MNIRPITINMPKAQSFGHKQSKKDDQKSQDITNLALLSRMKKLEKRFDERINDQNHMIRKCTEVLSEQINDSFAQNPVIAHNDAKKKLDTINEHYCKFDPKG